MPVRRNDFAVAKRLDDMQEIKKCRVAQDDRNRRLLIGYRRIRPELVPARKADAATGFSHYLHGLTISQAGTVINPDIGIRNFLRVRFKLMWSNLNGEAVYHI